MVAAMKSSSHNSSSAVLALFLAVLTSTFTGCCTSFCQNGGTENGPYCECAPGFYGKNCEKAIVFAFNGSSYVVAQLADENRLELNFKFKSLAPFATLANLEKQTDFYGQIYFFLELIDGRLNFWMENGAGCLLFPNALFHGTELNDGEWHSVKIRFLDAEVHLSVDQEERRFYLPHENSRDSFQRVSSVLFGGVLPLNSRAYRNPLHWHGFSGCLAHVTINWQRADLPVINGSLTIDNPYNITSAHVTTMGVGPVCPVAGFCKSIPCRNGGVCKEVLSTYKCFCQRPFTGDNCESSYKPATFGNDQSSTLISSFASVYVGYPENLFQFVELSLFVRTRAKSGLVFYVELESGFLAVELREGTLTVAILNVFEETAFDKAVEKTRVFSVEPLLNDGFNHLIKTSIKDNGRSVQLTINDTLHLNGEFEGFSEAQPSQLYLGGLPSKNALKFSPKRIIEAHNFKGILQDIQFKGFHHVPSTIFNASGNYSGDYTRIVEIFPLDDSIHRPPPLGKVERSGSVLEGVIADDPCESEPCLNGATCTATDGDAFQCFCPSGFEGSNCELNIDDCVDNKCVRGRCVDEVAKFTCKCEDGWTGILCDQMVNYCDPSPCKNNGTCNNKKNNNQQMNYTCQCKFGYYGFNCESFIDFCAEIEPCQNHATCTSVSQKPGYVCGCGEDFIGDVCSIRKTSWDMLPHWLPYALIAIASALLVIVCFCIFLLFRNSCHQCRVGKQSVQQEQVEMITHSEGQRN